MTDAAFSGPGWSISTEWQFYLLAPLLFRLIARPAGLTIFAVFVLLCLYLPGQFFFIGEYIPRACVLAQIHWFFLGMAFFHWYKGFAGFSTGEKWFYQAVTLVIVLNLAFHPMLLVSLCIWLFFFWLVVWGREHPESRAEKMAQFFNNPLLKYLGRISYPVYLLHWPVVILTSRVVLAIDPQIDRRAAYAVFIVVVPLATVGVAHIVHRYIEQPSIDFARNYRAGKEPARAVATGNAAPFLNEIQRKEP